MQVFLLFSLPLLLGAPFLHAYDYDDEPPVPSQIIPYPDPYATRAPLKDIVEMLETCSPENSLRRRQERGLPIPQKPPDPEESVIPPILTPAVHLGSLTFNFLYNNIFSPKSGAQQALELGIIDPAASLANKNKRGRENLAFWYPNGQNGFTSPLYHDTHKPFQYIIHAVHEHFPGIFLMEDLNKITDLSISGSLITQEKQNTYYPTGVILAVDPDLIFATHHENMARNGSPVQGMNWRFPIRTPEDLLEHTTKGINEVGLVGTHQDKTVRVIGLFMEVARNGIPREIYSQRRVDNMKKNCVERAIPVIRLY